MSDYQKLNDHQKLVEALKEALTDNSANGWALLERVPLICNDIRAINKSVEKLQNDMVWHKWLLLGIATGIGILALKTLGA